MKKTYTVLAAMALVGSAGSAQAADVTPTVQATPIPVCLGSTATKHTVAGGPGTPYTVDGSFVKVGFAVQCSANTHVSFANVSGTLFTVGGGSVKGNQSFKGSSEGGAVVTHSKCTSVNDACSSVDAQSAATAAQSSM